jgi:hypothetical protein
MTNRLETALKKLDAQELEHVTQIAESLAERKNPKVHGPPPQWRFEWVGGLQDRPEKSGVEAQSTAMREWLEMLGDKKQA